MRVISSNGLAALQRGRFALRTMLKVTIPHEDPFCIWDDVGNILFEGDLYIGRAGRFTIKPAGSSQDLSVRNLDVTLSHLDQPVVNLILDQNWHQQPILISRAVISIDAPAVLHSVPEFSGFLDQALISETGGGESQMTFKCESASRAFTLRGSRTRSDADQRERDSTDGFFKFTVSAITTTIEWGRDIPPPKQKGFAGFMAKVF